MKKANRKRREKRKCRLKIIKRRKKKKKGKEERKKKKRKRKRVEERKKRKNGILEEWKAAAKWRGKAGSPEASGDGGGRLGQSSRKSSNSCQWKQQAAGKSCSSYFCVLQNPFSSFW